MTTWAPQVSDVAEAIQYSSVGMGQSKLDAPVIFWTNEIVQRILGVKRWSFSERSTTTTTTANQRYVTVPANSLIGLRAVRDTTNDQVLDPTEKEIVYSDNADPDNATAGTPDKYYVEYTSGTAARIYFNIPWSAAVTLALDKWNEAEEITAASDLIPIPPQFFYVVKSGVKWLATDYQFGQDSHMAHLTKEARNEFLQDLNEMKRILMLGPKFYTWRL